jgi:hypothetical protein
MEEAAQHYNLATKLPTARSRWRNSYETLEGPMP